ncbi:MAG: hypothetical protein GY849_24680, partial [Deltaproteobacteria bacterium]|nr:hypothetical protein [Deltaproteobacteria bacterium]
PVPPCGAGVRERNRLADGGFEAGSPSAVWEEYSDNFPSPICTPTSCGLAGAQAGDAWAFFGGTTAVETASLAQSFTLFPGPATLGFFAWTAAAGGNGQDRFRILIDDAEVALLTEGDARYTGGYRPLEIDLAAFADGGSHQLRLEAATAGTPGISSFFVDEVAINACPDLTVPPELWIADRTVVEGDA